MLIEFAIILTSTANLYLSWYTFFKVSVQFASLAFNFPYWLVSGNNSSFKNYSVHLSIFPVPYWLMTGQWVTVALLRTTLFIIQSSLCLIDWSVVIVALVIIILFNFLSSLCLIDWSVIKVALVRITVHLHMFEITTQYIWYFKRNQ